MDIYGTRNLNYSVIHCYNMDIDKLNKLDSFLNEIDYIYNYIPVFYNYYNSFPNSARKWAIRCNKIPETRIPVESLHHILQDIRNINDIDMDFIQQLYNFQVKFNMCFYFTNKSTIKDRDVFLSTKEILDNLGFGIYPSFDINDQPYYNLVSDLLTERQNIIVDKQLYNKYEITFDNQVFWKKPFKYKCNIHKHILYYDGSLKLCPNSKKNYDIVKDLEFLKKALQFDYHLCSAVKCCSPYLFEYGHKKV